MLEYLSSAQPEELIGLTALSIYFFESLREVSSLRFSEEYFDIFRCFIEHTVKSLQTMVLEEPASDQVVKSIFFFCLYNF